MSPAVTDTALHPAQSAYLQARGITPETITANELHSARPQDLARLAGRRVPDGTSGLLIPYEGCDGFARVRLFPPISDGDGKEQKFGQPNGSPVRLYVPAGVREVLTDPGTCIFIIEGEVKALALTQADFPAVALGGVWNFREKELPPDELIPDLEAITWTGRIVYLVPDSDAWQNNSVNLAVYRFARLLEARGAPVFIIKLPTLDGQPKTGADDYLVVKSPAAFRRLVEKAVTLGHPAFRPFREQERARAREAKASQPLPATLVGRRMHPAIHFEEGFASLGIIEPGSEALVSKIITSDRKEYPAEALKSILTTPALSHKSLVNRWSADDRTAWLRGDGAPASFALAAATVRALFMRLMEIPDATVATLTAWTLGTYFHQLFPAFGRLYFTGEAGSGKSKAQQIVAGLAWNGLYRIVPTGPVLFRLIESFRPTYCVSEAEHIDDEQRATLLAVTNEGYLRGGVADRCVGDTHELKTFEVYSPMTLGGVRGLKGITESRCISLVMVRGTHRAKLNLDVNPDAPEFQAVRDLLHRLTLERFRDVAQTWETLPDPQWLVARERQLWRPLLILAHLADSESGGLFGLTETIRTAARRQTDDRDHPSEEAGALVGELREKLGVAEEIRLHPAELVDGLKARLHRDHVTSHWAGHLLKRNGFEKPPRPGDRDKDGVFYRITRAQLEAIENRYGPPQE